MFCTVRGGVLAAALLTVSFLVPCAGMASSSSSKKESLQVQTATVVKIQAESRMDVSLGSALKQKSMAKRPRGKTGDYTKRDLFFNGNYNNWDKDHFSISVKEEGVVSMKFDSPTPKSCIYRNIIANGEKLHEDAALGPIDVEVSVEAGKQCRISFESKRVTPEEAVRIEQGGGEDEKDAKAEKKDKKAEKKAAKEEKKAAKKDKKAAKGKAKAGEDEG